MVGAGMQPPMQKERNVGSWLRIFGFFDGNGEKIYNYIIKGCGRIDRAGISLFDCLNQKAEISSDWKQEPNDGFTSQKLDIISSGGGAI